MGGWGSSWVFGGFVVGSSVGLVGGVHWWFVALGDLLVVSECH